MLPDRLTAALAPWSFGVLLGPGHPGAVGLGRGWGLSAVLANPDGHPARTSEGS